MKIRKFLYSIGILFAAALAACDPTDEFMPSLSVQSTDGNAIASLTIPAAGATETFNIVSNVSWAIDSKADWITIDRTSSINTSQTTQTETITVTVDPNAAAESRQTTLSIVIEGKSVSLVVNQEAGSGIIDKKSDVEFVMGAALYSGDSFENGTNTWTFLMIDAELAKAEEMETATGTYCFINCIADAGATFEKGVPTGTFTISDATTVGVAYSKSSGLLDLESGQLAGGKQFTKGTVTVSVKNKQYTITADVTAVDLLTEEDVKLYLSYTGELEVIDDSTPEPDGDIKFITGVGAYYGNDYGDGTANWYVELWDEDYAYSEQGSDEGYVCALDCITDAGATFEKGLPVGTFTINNSLEKGTATTDYSGIFNYSEGEMTNNSANFTEGTITISETDGVYTITVDAMSELGSHQYSYTGGVELFDESTPELDGDLAFDAIDEVDLYYCGVYAGVPYWDVYVWNGDYMLNLVMNTDVPSFASGIPSGTYNVSSDDNYSQSWTIDYGYDGESSCLYSVNSDGYVENLIAPITGGSVVVENKSTTYKFTITLTNDKGNKITGVYDGEVYASDESESETAAQAKVGAKHKAMRKSAVATQPRTKHMKNLKSIIGTQAAQPAQETQLFRSLFRTSF